MSRLLTPGNFDLFKILYACMCVNIVLLTYQILICFQEETKPIEQNTEEVTEKKSNSVKTEKKAINKGETILLLI